MNTYIKNRLNTVIQLQNHYFITLIKKSMNVQNNTFRVINVIFK